MQAEEQEKKFTIKRSEVNIQLCKESIFIEEVLADYFGCKKKSIWPWSSELNYCQAILSLKISNKCSDFSVDIDVECTGTVQLKGLDEQKQKFTDVLTKTVSAHVFVDTKVPSPDHVHSIIIEYNLNQNLRVYDAKLIDVKCKITSIDVY